MNAFAQAVQNVNVATAQPQGQTANGAAAHADSGDALVSLFFTIGAARGKDVSAKFLSAYQADPTLALKMLFWARDVRGGAGERETFRKLLKVVEAVNPAHALVLVPLVPEYGRWDDLAAFDNPQVREVALRLWSLNILDGNGLAAKWAPRKGPLANELRKRMKLDPKNYRKTLVRMTQVVETAMCAKNWSDINYSHVPSVASSRYAKAFNRNDPVRYAEFKAAAVKGDVRINASTLYPYDVLKNIRSGDPITALAQWNALPNYVGDAGFILPVVDTSGSMNSHVGNVNSKLRCVDVAVSLGLYLADKQQGAFANMFLNFNSDSKIHYLQGNLLQKLHTIESCDWGGSTNLESAFKEILRVAVMNNVPVADMPKYLLVISDMGFNPSQHNAQETMFDMAKRMFAWHSYELPAVIWWNVAHREGGFGGDNNFPVQSNTDRTALVSGFSPSILRSVLSAKTVTPWDVMMETLDSARYQAVGAAIANL
jgi:hypothetical protein